MKLLLDIINDVISNINTAIFYTPPIYDEATTYHFASSKEVTQLTKNILQNNTLLDGVVENKQGWMYLNYEAGYLFDDSLNDLAPECKSYGAFVAAQPTQYKSSELNFEGISDILEMADYKIVNKKLSCDKESYSENINKIKTKIEEGYTYQVNYTERITFELEGNILHFILGLIFNQSAEYMAILNTPEGLKISVSPELFFRIEGNTIYVEPMKGTSPKGYNNISNLTNKNYLLESEKEIAENVMIVDLLRNDIGKICETNSVTPEKLFLIKEYESVLQMISIIKGSLTTKSFYDILEALYPCGSVTGAPKIETMKIINSLENTARGLYTGMVGMILNNKMVFNVPIRTVEQTENNKFIAGIGSGVVWDSEAVNEYNELLTKAKYLEQPQYFELLESMLLTNGKIPLLAHHLERLEKAAEFHLFYYNNQGLLNEINNYLIKNNLTYSAYKLRLTYSKWGIVKLNHTKIESKYVSGNVIISNHKINSKDKFLYYKTTNRKLYSNEFAKYKNEYIDVLFFNEKNYLAEGSITNIFLIINGKLHTPNLESGILDGVMRKLLVHNFDIVQREISIQDIKQADCMFLTNSVRGIIEVNELKLDDTESRVIFHKKIPDKLYNFIIKQISEEY